MPAQKRTFKALFCDRFGCPPAKYEDLAFREFLYWHGRLLAPLITVVRPRYFARDYAFIEEIAVATEVRDVSGAASYFHDKGNFERGLLSSQFRVRVSGRKAIKLAARLFAQRSPRPENTEQV